VLEAATEYGNVGGAKSPLKKKGYPQQGTSIGRGNVFLPGWPCWSKEIILGVVNTWF
jgi:hypothetical protein